MHPSIHESIHPSIISTEPLLSAYKHTLVSHLETTEQNKPQIPPSEIIAYFSASFCGQSSQECSADVASLSYLSPSMTPPPTNCLWLPPLSAGQDHRSLPCC